MPGIAGRTIPTPLRVRGDSTEPWSLQAELAFGAMRLMLLLLVLMVVPVATADAADTYAVDTCATGSGGPATITGWGFGGNAYRPVFACPDSGVYVQEPPPGVAYPDRIDFRMTFSAPAGTRIAGYRIWRTVTLTSAWTYELHEDGVGGRVVETCGPPCNFIARPVDGPPNFAYSGRDLGSLDLYAYCQVRCPGGDQALVTVKRLQVDLTDGSDPTLTSPPSGNLLNTTGPLTGVRSVSFAAADQGSGVYVARLEVDGNPVASATVDDNDGRCVKPFKDLVPCRGSAAGSLSFDTATLPDGPHAIRLVVTDATETNSVAYGPVQVTTSNQSAACTATSSPGLTARFVTTGKATLTRRGGGAFTLAGAAPAGGGPPLLAPPAPPGAGRAGGGGGAAA